MRSLAAGGTERRSSGTGDVRTRAVVALVVLAPIGCLLAPAAVGGVAAAADPSASTGGAGDGPAMERFAPVAPINAPTRIDRRNVLDQPTRADVYDAIEASPGVGLASLSETVDVTRSTVRYHVRVLRDAGLVTACEVGGSLRVSAADVDADLAAALAAGPTATVLAAVARLEPASVSAVADATDRAPSTVSHHLSGLAERGLVERERAGGAVLTSLTDPVRAELVSPATDGGKRTPVEERTADRRAYSRAQPSDRSTASPHRSYRAATSASASGVNSLSTRHSSRSSSTSAQ